MSEGRKIGFNQALFIATKMRAQFIYDMAKLEGNTVSYAQAETIVNGQSVAFSGRQSQKGGRGNER